MATVMTKMHDRMIHMYNHVCAYLGTLSIRACAMHTIAVHAHTRPTNYSFKILIGVYEMQPYKNFGCYVCKNHAPSVTNATLSIRRYLRYSYIANSRIILTQNNTDSE